MKIYTKTGDQGKTGLFGGARVSKDDIRIEAYGTVDELNSFLGHLADKIDNHDLKAFLQKIQSFCFVAGSILATDPDKPELAMKFDESIIAALEKEIDTMQESLEPLTNFILPGGHEVSSFCHIARTICRRAERRAVSLGNVVSIDFDVLIFLNRLSDYLFVLARHLAKENGAEEVLWKSN